MANITKEEKKRLKDERRKEKYLALVTSWVHALSDEDLITLENVVKTEKGTRNYELSDSI